MLFYIFGLAIKWHIMTIIETTCACMITFNVHCLTVFILLFRSLKGDSMVWIPWWLYSNCSKMQDMYEYYYTRDMLWYFEIAIIICFILNFFKFLNKNQLFNTLLKMYIWNKSYASLSNMGSQWNIGHNILFHHKRSWCY